jgi:peptide/nickel transport system permease protein
VSSNPRSGKPLHSDDHREEAFEALPVATNEHLQSLGSGFVVPAAPNAPESAEDPVPPRVVVAGQWQLIWWKFRRHKLALLGGVVTLLIYFVAAFADFLSPYAPDSYSGRYAYAPPQTIRLFAPGEAGGVRFFPHVGGYTVTTNPASLRRTFAVDPDVRHPIGLFVKGDSYRLLGLFPTDRHLLGPTQPGDPMYLFGADRLGRDVLSRTLHGTRVSMSIGLIGVGISLLLGILLGGISGYYGGWVDTLIQRLIEFLQSIPAIPLWMGLAAAIPLTMPPLRVYLLITLILSVIGWTGLGRVVRGKFYALKTEDFVTAAKLDGCSDLRIILRHMVPSFTSHIIAVVTLAIPGMILAETSLSFLGIGLRPPVVSWGVLLQEAQNIRSVAAAPWLFLPGAAVVIAVLSLNFLGDGLRDAADPYA